MFNVFNPNVIKQLVGNVYFGETPAHYETSEWARECPNSADQDSFSKFNNFHRRYDF